MNPKYDLIMLCGGKGRRLRAVTNDAVPKSLVQLGGKSLLYRSLENLNYDYVNKVIFAVDHKAEAIELWSETLDIPVEYTFTYQDEEGILPAVYSALTEVSADDFIICNTDEVRENFPFDELVAFHQIHDKKATVVAAYSDHLHLHRVLDIDDTTKVTASTLKPSHYATKTDVRGLVNTGFWLFNKSCIPHWDTQYGVDWSAMIDPLIQSGMVFAYCDSKTAYFNVGTPYEYEQAIEYIDTTA